MCYIAIAWNDSNIISLCLYFSSLNVLAPNSNTRLIIYLGYKCTLNLESLRSTLCTKGVKFDQLSIRRIQPDLIFHILGFRCRAIIARFATIFFNYFSRLNKIYFLLPSPYMPPIHFFLGENLTYYGDAISLDPRVSVLHYPSLSSLPIRSKITYICKKLDYLLYNLFYRPNFQTLFPSSIKSKSFNGALLSNLVINTVSTLYSDPQVKSNISSTCETYLFGESVNHLLVLSILSPLRMSLNEEIILYSQYILSLKREDTTIKTILIKPHYHHTDTFLYTLSQKIEKLTSIKLVVIRTRVPIEILFIRCSKTVTENEITFHLFQSSIYALSLIEQFYTNCSSKIYTRFGFGPKLIQQFFPLREQKTRLTYEKMIKDQVYLKNGSGFH